MLQIKLEIEGMSCGMCESHMNDVMRKTFHVEKVVSSYKKGETILITENKIDESLLRKAVEDTGYVLCGITVKPYKKKKFFFF